jgi:hypothetical protein
LGLRFRRFSCLGSDSELLAFFALLFALKG